MNERSYTKAVAKRLVCSKARRDEFVRDLKADIAAAREDGEPWEQIERRLGDPRQVAAEFNADLADSERAAGKKRKRNKIIGIALAAAAAVILVVAVAAWWMMPKYVPVGQASGHTEQEVAQQAEQVVELFNSEDAQALAALCNDALKPLVNDELFDSARATLEGGDWGAFEKFGTMHVGEFVYMGQTSNPVELVAIYERVTVTFTLAFDSSMHLTALYVK